MKNGKNGGARSFDAAVTRLLASVEALGAAIDALGLPVLTDDERLHSMGRLRAGEHDAITSILDAMDRSPATFASLADRDGGDDPEKLETAPARDAVERARVLAPLAQALQALAPRVSDAMLAYGEQAKRVTVPAYAVGKALAATDPKVRASMTKAINFYGGAARRKTLERTRAANKAKRGAKATAAGG